MIAEFGTCAELQCHGRRIEAEQLAERYDLNRAGGCILDRNSASIDVADGNRTAVPRFREPGGDRPLDISARPTVGQEGPEPIGEWLGGLKRLGEVAKFE